MYFKPFLIKPVIGALIGILVGTIVILFFHYKNVSNFNFIFVMGVPVLLGLLMGILVQILNPFGTKKEYIAVTLLEKIIASVWILILLLSIVNLFLFSIQNHFFIHFHFINVLGIVSIVLALWGIFIKWK